MKRRFARIAIPVLTACALLALWQAAVDFGWIARYLLPSPTDIARAFIGDFDLLVMHSITTLEEALLGLFFGVVLGFVLAVLMDACEAFHLACQPLITLSQTVPTVAIAPLLMLWLGYGMLPKVVLVIVTTFFPVAVNLCTGFASVDPDVIDLLRTMRASEIQIFWYAKLPAALSHFFDALRISATYAIVSALIAEWLGSMSGLGVYMTRVRKSVSFDRMFASIVVVSMLSVALVGLVNVLEWLCMPWKRAEGKRS